MGVLHPPRAAGWVGDVAQKRSDKVPGGGQPSPRPAQRGRGATAATSPPAPRAKGLGAKMRNPGVQLWFIPSLPCWGCHTIPFAPALWEGEHCPAARRQWWLSILPEHPWVRLGAFCCSLLASWKKNMETWKILGFYPGDKPSRCAAAYCFPVRSAARSSMVPPAASPGGRPAPMWGGGRQQHCPHGLPPHPGSTEHHRETQR